MTLNDYQAEAEKTAIYPDMFRVIYPALGITGEAGECADKVKKLLRDTEIKCDDHGRMILTDEQRQAIALELGDVLWYVTIFARDLGLSLEEVATMNINKLRSRQERGMLGGSGDYR